MFIRLFEKLLVFICIVLCFIVMAYVSNILLFLIPLTYITFALCRELFL